MVKAPFRGSSILPQKHLSFTVNYSNIQGTPIAANPINKFLYVLNICIFNLKSSRHIIFSSLESNPTYIFNFSITSDDILFNGKDTNIDIIRSSPSNTMGKRNLIHICVI